RQKLAGFAPDERNPELPDEKSLAEYMHRLWRAGAGFEKAFSHGKQGELPAMPPTELGIYLRNDPVPRLLWLAGQKDPQAPSRLLGAAGAEAKQWGPWRSLAEALAGGYVLSASNRLTNSSFAEIDSDGEEPK